MTPKMQLSPGDYVTEAFRAETNNWLIDFFGYEEEPPAPVYNDSDLQPRKYREPLARRKAQQKAIRKPSKSTQVQPDIETFSGLLSGLEDSFHTMRVPQITGSWLAKKDVNAIKKLGVYIPTPFLLEFHKNPEIPPDTPFPAIASAFFVPRKADVNDKIYPRFAYLIKGVKLPENVEVTRGTPFQFGVCYELQRTENGKPMSPKVFWAWCWMVVTPDRLIRIPHEKRRVSVNIQHRHAQSGYKNRSGARSSTAHLSHWVLPSMVVAEMGQDQAAYEQMMTCSFRQLMVWWHKRQQQWSVGVRKDGNRATFSIAPEHTSAYFADRDTVVNVEGKPKKIIHFVREHERINGSNVKAHVRGLREFDWKGYHCAVTAPQLNGALTTNYPSDPVLVERSEFGNGYMETQDMAVVLADAEDALTTVEW